MSAEATPEAKSPWSGRAPALTVASVLLLSISLTWAFFAMRAVMDVGGSCADGGPYVSSQSCPGGAGLIAIAIPVMLVAAMVGSAAATSIRAPDLLIPMWGFLFGALGWNFLEFSFKGEGVNWGWLVCGVVFWLMAAPAVYGILVAVKNAVLPPAAQGSPRPRWWVPAYAALGAAGTLAGAWTFALLS
jgi:hypothetical protein